MGSDSEGGVSVFFCCYLTFCVTLIGWIILKFFRGRRQVRFAFETIENQLQLLQALVDQEGIENNDAKTESKLSNNNDDEEVKSDEDKKQE